MSVSLTEKKQIVLTLHAKDFTLVTKALCGVLCNEAHGLDPQAATAEMTRARELGIELLERRVRINKQQFDSTSAAVLNATREPVHPGVLDGTETWSHRGKDDGGR